MINFGGWVPLSTVDYPGLASTVIFLRGCHVRCERCHNKHLWDGREERTERYIFDLIDSTRAFVSAVVISGGEPLDQPDAVRSIAAYAHGIGMKVCVHTSGEGELGRLLPYVDVVLLSRPVIGE